MFKNYNMNQLILPLDLENKLQKNDIAYHIHHLVENIPNEHSLHSIYRQRKIDLKPVFGFLKAILGFTRFSLRGKSKVKIEMDLALIATNLRKYVLQGM